jgi:hypothetical protein
MPGAGRRKKRSVANATSLALFKLIKVTKKPRAILINICTRIRAFIGCVREGVGCIDLLCVPVVVAIGLSAAVAAAAFVAALAVAAAALAAAALLLPVYFASVTQLDWVFHCQ